MRARLLLIALALTGCEGYVPRATPIGVPVVESETSVWGAPRTLLGPSIRVGQREGSGPATFADLGSARFLADGKIGVSDSGSERLVIFDSLGGHVATLGRRGQGPDEFSDLARLYPYPGDSVAAFDFGTNRTLIFPTQGGASRIIPGLHHDIRAPLVGVLESGSLLAYQTAGALRMAPTNEPGWDSTLVVLVQRNGRGSRGVAKVAANTRPSAGESQRPVLAPTSILVAGRDGFYWARTDHYEIHRFDSLGAPLLVIRRQIEPEPLGLGLREEYRTGTLEGARRVGGEQLAQTMENRLRSATFADTRPLFGGGFVDHEGRLWVSELPWPSRYDAPRRWSVFSDEGQWLGDVEPPDDVHLHDASGDRVLGVWRDEVGVQYVVVYRLATG